ncbi:G-D-S-L family lipolytic protein [Aquimarina gracilis]|uniref:G-D-S-L family lipolytic protein n=1 Tax=Aquimarina gracilis TaxID=874422 RepID=A0ABU6A076_9FLAO|nr:G-D-S-L family lipolytic protein [Aquimarina gracilis]MEB3347522.1 G-D-S-L family lipolytic protein [Aquimarina gracilis]
MNTQYKWLILLLIFGFIACESDDDAPTDEEVVITSGEADFSKFVSIGNSLTAGFTDNALFIAGQENSMPNILAGQFALAGGGDFIQPLMNDNIGGLLLAGTQIQGPRLYFYSDPDPAPPSLSGPVPLGVVPPTDLEPEIPTTDITVPVTGTINNWGVPGAKSFHLVAPGYGDVSGVPAGTANPYFARIASGSTSTVLGDAMGESPTFFSLWIGNNDVLGYALSGGESDPEMADPITDVATFTQVYNTLVETLTSQGAKGVIFNIPDVTAIAHFTTVPFAPLDPTNPGFGPLIPTLNTQFAGLNQVFTALGVPERAIEFAVDAASPVVIKDESLMDLSAQITGALQANGVDAGTAAVTGFLYGQARPANENDLLVLPSSSIIGQVNTDAIGTLMMLGLTQEQAGQLAVNGVTYPLEDKWVLLPSEQAEIAEATTAFNAVIDAAVQREGLAFVDANDLLDQVSDGGLQFDDFLIQDDLVFGGLFSLDGVHPTARGYAFLANEAARAINTTYGSNLPMVKAADYPTFYSTMLP